MNQHKLSAKRLFDYAALAMPLAMLGLPLYVYLPTFYVQHTGLSMALVGGILFVSRLTDVITDLLVGLYSDRFGSNYGKRKPLMFFGSLILLASFYALIHPPEAHTAWWLLVFSMMVYLGWSIVSIPYLAWSAEITADAHEKTRLSAARELFTIIGAMGALVIPYLYGVSENAQRSLSVLYDAFVLSLVLLLPFTLLGTKEKPAFFSGDLRLKHITQLWQKIPSLYTLQIAFSLNSLANALPATLFLLYVELVLQEASKTGLLLLLYFASGIIALPFWTLVSRTIGKRKTWQTSMLLASSAFVFVPFLGSHDLVFFALITFVSGLSLGADMALPSSIQADAAQRLQADGRSYAGILFGIWAMLTKFSLALAVGIGFVLLGMVGFDPKVPTPSALMVLSLLYGGAPVVLKILSYWILLSYHEAA